ncbi:MAG: tRNA preQ1(34) S-adenosylmethionine ribosyltransferase-isomerase QueA [Dehalococcoidales bacterium]
METKDFDYYLPPELIAQTPLEPRDSSRMMVLDRGQRTVRHQRFYEITDYLVPGDVLVFNESRVIPARLIGSREGGGRVEVLLLRSLEAGVWEALLKPGKRLRLGCQLKFGDRLAAEVTSEGTDGVKTLRFSGEVPLDDMGIIPLPPYIRQPLERPERYQTVYARSEGSVAAPTAGLHFTPELITRMKEMGVNCVYLSLHIGLDTFRPVRVSNPEEHPIHQEYGVLGIEAAGEITRAKEEGRRVLAVGTSTMRLLETAAVSEPPYIKPFSGWTKLMILPGHRFRIASGLVTNFHLPRSTLLMLVSAFAGQEFILQAYQEAISKEYRFYSFGDAMLVL